MTGFYFNKIGYLIQRLISLICVIITCNLRYRKEKRERKLSLSKRSFIIINEWEARQRQCLRYARRKGFVVAFKENLQPYKTCDTLFILGSGPSINDLTGKQWVHISARDSIGFNFFLLHPHVPTYYSVELRPAYTDLFLECYRATAPEFKKIPVLSNLYNLMNLPEKQLNSIRQSISNLYGTAPRMFKGAGKQNLEEILHYHYSTRNFVEDNLLIHYRASLMLTLSLGVLLGYKNIVLAGIDMSSNDYFFFDQKKYHSQAASRMREYKKKRVNKYLEQKGTAKALHRTLDPQAFKELPLDQAVLIFNESVLKPKQIKLSLLSEKSLLYPSLPLYS